MFRCSPNPYKRRDPQWCLQQAATIGPHCQALIEALFAHPVLDRRRAAQGVIGLASRYGADRLEAACARALRFDSPRYRTVKTILDQGADQQPLPPTSQPVLAPAYTGQGRFCRDSAVLFASPLSATEPQRQEVIHAAHA